MRPISRFGHGSASFQGYWVATTVILTALTALAVVLLATIDRATALLPVALRQPAIAIVLIAVPLLPALAIRAGEKAMQPRPHLSLVPTPGPSHLDDAA